MANIPPMPISDPFLKAMADTLAQEMTDYLKKPLLELTEAKINEAVRVAVDAMRPRIEAYVSNYDMRTVINVITAPPGGLE